MKANQAAWPVRTMCRVLGLSPPAATTHGCVEVRRHERDGTLS